MHHRAPAHAAARTTASARTQHGSGLMTDGLCRDKGVSIETGDGGFHVAT